jgi:hypothetical protein
MLNPTPTGALIDPALFRQQRTTLTEVSPPASDGTL